jgi:acyl-CoA synthetase (AMP-forming)/AMP-acid ligase II
VITPHGAASLTDAATGATLAGTELADRVDRATASARELPDGLAFALMPTTVDAIVRYFGLVAAGRPVALIDPALDRVVLERFIERFMPAIVVGIDSLADQDPPQGHALWTDASLGSVWINSSNGVPVPHHDLGLMLPTSGSTGNPKFVRLARSAVRANVDAVIAALDIGPDDVTITTLPFFYSFGLSVLHSHLAAGATVIVESIGLTQRSFWDAHDTWRVTTMNCVPYQFEILHRLRFDSRRHPTLMKLTQAGGRLAPDRVSDFADRMETSGGALFIMYGQTEAGPRMTTLPPSRVRDKLGSVGPAISGGALAIVDEKDTESSDPRLTGAIRFRGPSVMMGYAESAADVPRGDERAGVLDTGDLGHLDDDGYLYIDGRASRLGKAFGVRVNLDDVERMVGRSGTVAAVSAGDRLVVWLEGAEQAELQPRAQALAQRLHLHWSGVEFRTVDRLPLLSNGKVDLRSLESQSG